MAAEKATLTAAATITWEDTTPFNGYVLLLMALPSSSGALFRLRLPRAEKKAQKKGSDEFFPESGG